jgi:hypothetical protein
MLEVVTTTGSMDGIDATGILDMLDVVVQFDRRIGRKASKWSHLPEPGKQI